MVIYLVIEDLLLYLIVKPTTSAFGETEMSLELNPDILICSEPAYDGRFLKYVNFKPYLKTNLCKTKVYVRCEILISFSFIFIDY